MKKEVLIRFGNKVRNERVRLGLSQEELASKANVHRTYLENIEKIAKALNLSISELTDI